MCFDQRDYINIKEVINELNKAFHFLEEKPEQYLKILVKNQ